MYRYASRLKSVLVVTLVLALLQVAPAAGSPLTTAVPVRRGQEAWAGLTDPGRRGPAQTGTDAIVVRLAPGANRRAFHLTASRPGVRVDQAPGLAELGYVLLRVTSADLETHLARVRLDPSVAAAEPGRLVYSTETIPNDPLWEFQYGPPLVQATRLWSVAPTDRPVTVAIIDTGVDYNHADLRTQIWINTAETPGSGRDADGNGYLADWRGWDFANGDNDPFDDNGHGTHVAGITGAAGNNTLGIAGMAWNARLMALKVLQANGVGFDFHVAEAIVYAAKNGAGVINLSLGGTLLGTVVEDAVNFAHERGVILVAAAGNQGQASLLYPAAYDNVIAVTATDSSNALASFSNYGAEAELAAPGSGIYSTLPGNTYGYMWGTSMAAPHVSGAAVVLMSMSRFAGPKQVRHALRTTALDLGDAGRDPYFGFGLLQTYNAANGFSLCQPGVLAGCYHLYLPLALLPWSPD
jgi:subtilisin family serine protease